MYIYIYILYRTINSLIISLKTVLPGTMIFDVAGGPDPIAVAAEIEQE